MEQRVDAIYEDGVLKPLSPLSLANHERVGLTVGRPLHDKSRIEEWEDPAFQSEAEAEADDAVSLERVREALAKIRQPIVDAFREERDLR